MTDELQGRPPSRWFRYGNQRIEIRPNEDGTIDEIVGHSVDIHIEQMDDNCYWADIGGVVVHWMTKRAPIRLELSDGGEAKIVEPHEPAGTVDSWWRCATCDSKELGDCWRIYHLIEHWTHSPRFCSVDCMEQWIDRWKTRHAP